MFSFTGATKRPDLTQVRESKLGGGVARQGKVLVAKGDALKEGGEIVTGVVPALILLSDAWGWLPLRPFF